MAQRPRRGLFGLWYAGSSAGLKMYAVVHVFALPLGAALAVIGGLMLHVSALLIAGICAGAVGVVDSVVVYPVLNSHTAKARAATSRSGAAPPPDPRPDP